MHIVQDYENQISTNNNIKIKLVCEQNEDNAKAVGLIHADKYRINQVISNLVSNSIKFTREGGTISIKIRTVNSSNNVNNAITVSVKDTGIGIDPEIMPILFSKFATKSDIGTGIGLGLYISRSIIEDIYNIYQNMG